jgi:hypothetical protein
LFYWNDLNVALLAQPKHCLRLINLSFSFIFFQTWCWHRRKYAPAIATSEGVISAKCQTVGISKDRHHPAFSAYRPSMDIKKPQNILRFVQWIDLRQV